MVLGTDDLPEGIHYGRSYRYFGGDFRVIFLSDEVFSLSLKSHFKAKAAFTLRQDLRQWRALVKSQICVFFIRDEINEKA